jgi:hypothetical protein
MGVEDRFLYRKFLATNIHMLTDRKVNKRNTCSMQENLSSVLDSSQIFSSKNPLTLYATEPKWSTVLTKALMA